MEYTTLGPSGLAVSRICLGMMAYGSPEWRPWVLDESEARPIFRKAVEFGVNYFDTADMYSAGESEILTGRLVREFCQRDEVVIATKGFFPVDPAFKGGAASGPKPARRPNADGLSRKRLRHAVDMSLRRLGVDYIDLYQIHRHDPQTPIEVTMEALHDLVKAGKILHIGASTMPAWRFAKAQQVALQNGWTRFVSMQHHYNLVYREEEREMIPLCRDQGVALVPWSGLARGVLAGTRRSSIPDADRSLRAKSDDIADRYYGRDGDQRVLAALSELAAEKGVGNAVLAHAWLISKGMTALAVGATKVEHVEQAVAAIDYYLSADDIAHMESCYEPHPVIG